MTPIKQGARYGAYHRVSQLGGRDPDADNYLTERQAWEQIDGWAQMRKVQIAERYLDRDVSGSKMDRPALNRMLDDLRSGAIDGIAVAKVDRLSRADVGDALKVVAEINEIAPGQMAILDLGLDPGSDTGEMILGVLLVLGRWQWKRFKRQWENAKERAIERKVFVGPCPIGYRRTKIRTPKGDLINGPLELDPGVAKIIKEAFEVAAEQGHPAAVKYLAKALPSRNWNRDSLRKMLSSRAYLGEARSGDFVKRGAHPPLVDPETWQAAQQDPRARRANRHYALSGIAKCGKCGSSMVGGLQHVKGRTYRRMRCAGRGCGSVRAEGLEDYVRSALMEALDDKVFRLNFTPGGLEEARETLGRAEAELASFLADRELEDIVGRERFLSEARSRRAAVDAARENYQAIAGRAATAQRLPAADELEDPEKFAQALRVVADHLHIEVKPGRGPIEERVCAEWTS